MHHAITIGDLALGVALLIGLGICAFGALAAFAGGMSDNPEASASASKSGCIALLVGGALVAGAIYGLM